MTSVVTIVYLSRAGELLRKIIDKGGDEFFILSYIKLHINKTPNVRSGKKQQALAIPWQAG